MVRLSVDIESTVRFRYAKAFAGRQSGVHGQEQFAKCQRRCARLQRKRGLMNCHLEMYITVGYAGYVDFGTSNKKHTIIAVSAPNLFEYRKDYNEDLKASPDITFLCFCLLCRTGTNASSSPSKYLEFDKRRECQATLTACGPRVSAGVNIFHRHTLAKHDIITLTAHGTIHTLLENPVTPTSSLAHTTNVPCSPGSTSMHVTSSPRRTAPSFNEVLSPTAVPVVAAATLHPILR